MAHPFLYGWFLSFGLIIPLGPQNIFIFNEGVEAKNIRSFIPVVIAAAICDTLLIILSVLGLTELVIGLPQVKYIVMIIGAIFLSFMGFMSWQKWKNDTAQVDAKHPVSLKRKIFYAVTLSVLNPHAMIDAMTVLGTNALLYQGHDRTMFTIACIINSWLWFFGLAVVGKYFGNYSKVRRFLNLCSALIIWLCAIVLIRTVIKDFNF